MGDIITMCNSVVCSMWCYRGKHLNMNMDFIYLIMTIVSIVREVISRMSGEFSRAQILNGVYAVDSDLKKSTISAQIVAFTVNNKTRVWYRGKADVNHDLLFRVKRGIYERYDPIVHGVWDIVIIDGERIVVHAETGDIGSIEEAIDEVEIEDLVEFAEEDWSYVEEEEPELIEAAAKLAAEKALEVDAEDPVHRFELETGKMAYRGRKMTKAYKVWRKTNK